MEEWFDVVDRSDTVIGRASREKYTEMAFCTDRHTSSFRCFGRVLLQKRSEGKGQVPGCWDSSVSGHVDSGKVTTSA